MRTGLRRLTVLLLISLVFGIWGYFLYSSAYEKELCVLAAVNQAEPLKLLPHILDNGEVTEMPAYYKDPLFTGRHALKGYIIGSYYEGSASRRLAEIRVSGRYFTSVSLAWVIDARVRR